MPFELKFRFLLEFLLFQEKTIFKPMPSGVAYDQKHEEERPSDTNELEDRQHW